jgi:hypothetical protein
LWKTKFGNILLVNLRRMKMNRNRCSECKYNTPKTKGGSGRNCNGITMEKYQRCPEWAINAYLASKTVVIFTMHDVIQSMRVV